MGLYAVVNAVIYLAEIFIIYTYISDIFERKYSMARTVLLGCLLFLPPYVCNELWNSTVLNVGLFFVETVLFLQLTYQIRFLQSFLHGLLLTCLMFAAELCCFYAAAAVFSGNSFYAYRDSPTVYILDALSSKILFLLVCKICSRFKTNAQSQTDKLPIAYYLYALSSLLLSLCLVAINGQYAFSNTFQILLILLATVLLFSLIFIFISYEKSVAKNAELAELRTAAQIQRLDEKYYRLLKRQNEEMQAFAHDTKHHFSAILHLSSNEKVQQYIQSVYPDLDACNIVGKTQNNALDIILSEYRTVCAQAGIAFECEFYTANLQYIAPARLISLFTNLLDNAVEAAGACDDGKIELCIRHVGNFDMLMCKNSCLTPPAHDATGLKTSKKNREQHGFGTKNIEKIVKLYHGILRYRYDAKTRMFEVTALFPEQKP